MSVLTILRDARELVTDPANFTTGVLARDAKGHSTLPESSTATCFCTLGAMRAAANGNGSREFHEACTVVENAMYDFATEAGYDWATYVDHDDDVFSIANMNDYFGHMFAVAALDEAIAREVSA